MHQPKLKLVLLLIAIIQFVQSHSQVGFISCVDCDVEDSIYYYPSNSIVMNGGINEIVEGLILVPYIYHNKITNSNKTGIRYVGLGSGQVKHDFLIDTTGKIVVRFCQNRNDSTSFLVGYTTVNNSSTLNQDSIVAWIGILDHNSLSITHQKIIQFQNSRFTQISGILFNTDSSITAIGRHITPYSNYAKNFKAEISSNLSTYSIQAYQSSSFPTSVNAIRPFTVKRLSNGRIIYTGQFGCNVPNNYGDGLGIEEIHPNMFATWSYNFQNCYYTNKSLAFLTLSDDSFYTFREVLDANFSLYNSSYIEVTHFGANKSILNTFNFRTTSEVNTISCSPVMDSDSNIVCLLNVSDSAITGLNENYTIGRVVKIDKTGNVLWHKDVNYFASDTTYSLNNEWLSSLTVLPNDDIIISGNIRKIVKPISDEIQDYYIYVERLTKDGCSVNGCADYYMNTPEIKINSFNIYPNPSNGIFKMEFGNAEATRIKVYDLSGRLLKDDFVNGNTHQVDLSQFNNGLYLVSVFMGETWKTEKIVLDK